MGVGVESLSNLSEGFDGVYFTIGQKSVSLTGDKRLQMLIGKYLNLVFLVDNCETISHKCNWQLKINGPKHFN